VLFAKLVGLGFFNFAFPPAKLKVTSEVSRIPVPSLFVNTSSSNVTMIAVLSAFGVIVFTSGPARSFNFIVFADCVVAAPFPALS
jgi:hypothetical protein